MAWHGVMALALAWHQQWRRGSQRNGISHRRMAMAAISNGKYERKYEMVSISMAMAKA